MKYEWKEEKRRTNLFKHGLDFIAAANRVLASPYRLDVESRRNNEVRIQSLCISVRCIGSIDGCSLAGQAVF